MIFSLSPVETFSFKPFNAPQFPIFHDRCEIFSHCNSSDYRYRTLPILRNIGRDRCEIFSHRNRGDYPYRFLPIPGNIRYRGIRPIFKTLASSSTSSSRQKRYQVFLSFRGPDSRYSFTSYLRDAMEKSGVNVFYDDKNLPKGEDVAPELSRAIADSNISVIILSKDYASSNSCLDELCDIMRLKKTEGHTVLPIFYHVDPSDVKNADGSFKTSFEEHRKNRPAEEVGRWEAAFREVGNLEGGVIKGDKDDRPETEYISDIVGYVKFPLTKHQIFLSFGEKKGLNFTDNLHKALERRGLNVVKSNENLEEKSQAIATSDISVIIFSDDYASSESCLAEVSEIMMHRETQKQIVLPIFYQVKPSVVRQQISAFGEAGNIKGWHIKGENCDRSEIEYIEEVVEDVIEKMERKSRCVSKGLVGIYDQKGEILDMTKQDKKRVIIGLWGPGGIGKTTLSEAVYNELFPKFYNVCFVQKVSEKIKKEGKEPLRDQLLSKLLKSEIRVDTPSIGCPITINRLENTKALVVLDDVSDFEHIADMGIEYLGDGSKILVTSRERQVLKNAGANEIHKVERLSDKCSFQLFSAIAFKHLKHITDEFLEASSKFLRYAQGNPLALIVLGRLLYDKPIGVWNGEADKLGEFGQPKILDILERSYQRLGVYEQKIFLDIAIFFKGDYPKEYVEAFLSSCYGGGYRSGIDSLVDRCLLEIRTIDHMLKFSMHDILEELGKHIEAKDHSGNRRRLWRPEDVNPLLKYNQGANSIEGIKYQMFGLCGLELTGFSIMPNLRFVEIFDNMDIIPADPVDITVLPDSLRYLDWLRYPFKSLSSTFNPVNLVVLRLSWGKMERLWNGDQVPLNLMELDVSSCHNLEEIPNLSGATNLKILDCRCCYRLEKLAGLKNLKSLEKLSFYRCTKLKKIPSLSGATKLKTLDCEYCTSLVELAGLENLASLEELIFGSCRNLVNIANLSGATKLKILNFSGCYSLVKLGGLENMASLEKLKFGSCKNLVKIPNLSGATKLKILECEFCTSLVELPPLNHLTSLVTLSLLGCESLKKFPEIPNHLSELNLSSTGIEEVFASIDHVIKLKRLTMRLSKVKKVSRNISKLKYLKVLRMDRCYDLEILPQLPPNLVELDAHDCKSLTQVSFTVEDPNLPQLDPLPNTVKIFYNFSECSLLEPESVNNIAENVIHKMKYLAMGSLSDPYPRSKQLFCCLPGEEISANKFEFQSESCSLSFEIDKSMYSSSGNFVFSIFLVVDLTCFSYSQDLRVVCYCQLTPLTGTQAGRAKYRCRTYCIDKMNDYLGLPREYKGDTC